MSIYLDNAATTALDPRVVEAMEPFWQDRFANASSIHVMGQQARQAIEESREQVAHALSTSPKELIFTGSGTESNNLTLKGLFFEHAPKKNHIITTTIEHDCVLNVCRWLESRGAEVTYLPVNEEGFIDSTMLEDMITDRTFVVSIIHANNEIGTIQNLKKLVDICHKRGVLFHSDACQSFTKIPINLTILPVDLLTINAHKIHGPKGVAALFIRQGTLLHPLLHGGGQEFGLRSSTENVPGIVGFAKAVEIASVGDVDHMTNLRDGFMARIEGAGGIRINGPRGDRRLCNNINLSFSMIEGEQLQSELSKRGIYVSTGSACSSGSKNTSHVMKAIQCPMEYLHGNLRISLSKWTSEEDLETLFSVLDEIVTKTKMNILANKD